MRHVNLALAKLTLWPQHSEEEIYCAQIELLDKGYIVPCPNKSHPDTCIVLVH